MGRAEEVGRAEHARLLEFRNALRLFVSMDAIGARPPTATLGIHVTPEPVNDRRSSDIERAGDLRVILSLFGKIMRFLKIFSLPLVSYGSSLYRDNVPYLRTLYRYRDEV